MLTCGVAHAQLDLLPDKQPQMFFGGNAHLISAIWNNPSSHTMKVRLQTRLSQAASTVTAPVSGAVLKELTVFPGQTVVENTLVEFPPVRSKTAFVIQWLEDSSRVLGTTTVLIYPTNLLHALQAFVVETNFGVLDPDDKLRSLLDSQGVPFVDLAEAGWDKFAGKLVLIGPFQPAWQATNALTKKIQNVAKNGMAVVWLRTAAQESPGMLPEVLSVQIHSNAAIIVAQPDSIADLADNPQSQLNLIRFCEMALDPKRFGFPHFDDQP